MPQQFNYDPLTKIAEIIIKCDMEYVHVPDQRQSETDGVKRNIFTFLHLEEGRRAEAFWF